MFLPQSDAGQKMNWKVLSLIYLGITLNFVCLFCFFTLHNLYLSGDNFNHPPLLDEMSSLALFDAPVIIIGAFLTYMVVKKINFISVMKIISVINVIVICFILYIADFYKADLCDFLMVIRFIQMLLIPPTLILPTIFCFSITHEKHYHKLSYFTPFAMAFAGLVCSFTKNELVSLEIKSCFVLSIFSSLVSFLCFFVSKGMKYHSFYDAEINRKSITEMDRNAIKLALFLCGFLFAAGIVYAIYFSNPYVNEILIMVITPANLPPIALHCFLLVVFLPIVSNLYKSYGLSNTMILSAIGVVIVGTLSFFNPSMTKNTFLIIKIIHGISCSIMMAPLYWVVYRLSTLTGKLYKPMLWTIGGFSFSLVLRSLFFFLPQNVSPLFTGCIIKLVGLLAFILLVPKINGLLSAYKK